jgi:hypothetical protein
MIILHSFKTKLSASSSRKTESSSSKTDASTRSRSFSRTKSTTASSSSPRSSTVFLATHFLHNDSAPEVLKADQSIS